MEQKDVEMNDKKQIEDIAKILNECCNEYDEQGNHLGNKCASCECWSDTNHVCVSYNTKEAEALYNAGYRKQSDIIDEFVKRLLDAFPEGNRDAKCPAIYYDDYRYIIEELAEEMKGGAE